ncbi:MAG TPA: S41 family peptidase [Candidatus Polarisedimenticolia bacterium]|nr:S41 family peptidase [Candidatus Polarisedimenticolia bacterium]
MKPVFRRLLCAAAVVVALAGARPARALEECRLLRQPDIQGDRIVFVYAGDLWTVPRAGGVAARLTTHDGLERFPKLSPDGKMVAFTAEYDGNIDAYSVAVEGGEPQRLTWHPDNDQVAEWYPDGKSILIRSQRASSIRRYDRFFKVPAAGGFESLLPLPTAGYATLSADGKRIAYVMPSYDNRTWKRYQGGNAPEIWVYDFEKNSAFKMTDWPGADEWPMWFQDTVYYATDKGGRTVNLWAYDTKTKQSRQVTKFNEYDVKWPSIGGNSIVFENGGYLNVMDLPTEKITQIKVLVPDDKPATRAELKNVSKFIGNGDLSPSAKRAVLDARGDIFTVPAEKGDARNLTQSPGSRERDPAWSPDGRWIAYLSDRSGEYEVHVIGADGKTPDRQVTKGGNTFRYPPRWSPDSKKVAFSDKTMTVWWCDIATGKITKVDKGDNGEIFDYVWSGDSRFIAYSKPGVNAMSRVMLYALESGQATTVSSGMFDDFGPAFDPAGDYLYFISRRTLHPRFGQFEIDFQWSDTDRIYAAPLRASLASPVAPQSDEEKGDDKPAEGKDDDKDKAADKKGDAKDKEKDKDAKEGKDGAVKPWVVELDGIGARLAEIPVAPSRYAGLSAVKGKLIYVELAEPDPNGNGPGQGTIKTYDLEKRKEATVIAGVVPGYSLSKDGGKLLYSTGDAWGIIDVSEGKKPGDGKIETSGLAAVVDPRQEWMQMFNEAWRLERDFYYDPAMGGLDWKAVGERYRPLVPYVAHRADLNYIFGDLIGELSTSHAYVGGGDVPPIAKVDIGLLGADYTLDEASGRYRFATIYRDRDWNTATAAPLGEPGIDVKQGDYLLQVNGRDLKAPKNLYAAFEGTTGKQTLITVGSSPDDPKLRTYTVKPAGEEGSLRYTAWVKSNRERVEKATGGRIAYIHVPNTAIAGMQEFTKQYYPQVGKDGIIVDERFNGGGFIPDFFIDRLRQTRWVAWSNRDSNGFYTPTYAIDGPKCILINEYAGSGGDAFPFYFRQQGLGPVIGKRTWGGLVGISHNLPLVDGGAVTMPDFGMYDPRKGEWLVENHGVDPDIEVENAPDLMVSGHDPQLERAIDWVNEQLKKNPPPVMKRPPYKVQK